MCSRKTCHRIELESGWVGSRDEKPFKGLPVKTRLGTRDKKGSECVLNVYSPWNRAEVGESRSREPGSYMPGLGPLLSAVGLRGPHCLCHPRPLCRAVPQHPAIPRAQPVPAGTGRQLNQTRPKAQPPQKLSLVPCPVALYKFQRSFGACHLPQSKELMPLLFLALFEYCQL